MDFFESIETNETNEIIITQEFLDNYWLQLIDSDQSQSSKNAKHVFIEQFYQSFTNEDENNNLYFKTKGWKIIVKKHLIKGAIISPALYGILTYLGVTTGIGTIILPTIIPMLFDVENIEIKKSEETILLNLPQKKFKNKFKSVKEWYENLEPKIKKQINFIDFQDFMEKLVEAGYAKANNEDKFLVFKKGKNIFKITIE